MEEYLEGRSILDKGLIWRVGNEAKINIKEFPWLPNLPNFKVRLREDPIINIEWVNQLLVSNPRKQNKELTERAFDSHEAALIQQIPLAEGDIQDSVYWAFDPKGLYIVKSGYKVCQNSAIEQHRLEDQEYNQLFSVLSQFKQTWKAIWEMKTQPKTRIFIWRVARNLPKIAYFLRTLKWAMVITYVMQTQKRFGICLVLDRIT